jgi:phosphoglycolate phosphatase-like HAD superfamily hydrolase
MRRAPGITVAETCQVRLVVLDFDGTLTDADAHAPAFLAASRRALAGRLGWNGDRIEREWAAQHAVVTALPSATAWTVDGLAACPANGDPYLTANSIVRRLLAEHAGLAGGMLAAGVMDVHRAAYEEVPPPFRADARALLEGLVTSGLHVGVVTNSRTDTVERLLDALGFAGRGGVRVRGDAAKFSIGDDGVSDPRLTALPATVEWPELARPIHLHRGRYFDVLAHLWSETDAGAATTLVVGDNFELDLVMPAALGAHVHLVLRSSTMPHEIRLARAMARGASEPGLLAVLDRIRR